MGQNIPRAHEPQRRHLRMYSSQIISPANLLFFLGQHTYTHPPLFPPHPTLGAIIPKVNTSTLHCFFRPVTQSVRSDALRYGLRRNTLWTSRFHSCTRLASWRQLRQRRRPRQNRTILENRGGDSTCVPRWWS